MSPFVAAISVLCLLVAKPILHGVHTKMVPLVASISRLFVMAVKLRYTKMYPWVVAISGLASYCTVLVIPRYTNMHPLVAKISRLCVTSVKLSRTKIYPRVAANSGLCVMMVKPRYTVQRCSHGLQEFPDSSVQYIVVI
jgi:hypothetical protein